MDKDVGLGKKKKTKGLRNKVHKKNANQQKDADG